jgi:hypothetical protein
MITDMAKKVIRQPQAERLYKLVCYYTGGAKSIVMQNVVASRYGVLVACKKLQEKHKTSKLITTFKIEKQ